MGNLRRLLFVSLVFVPVQLQAQTPPDARTHDGFFLRFLLGAGPGRLVVEDVMGSDMELTSDAAGAFHVQIGGAVTENLILFGDLGGFAMTDPDLEYGGAKASGGDLEVTASGIGGGATYYLMPANVYVSGSVLASVNSLTFQGEDTESEWGPSFLLAVGKEWWVGNRWGLGVTALAEFGFTKDQRDPTNGEQPDIRTRMFGLAFSATMN